MHKAIKGFVYLFLATFLLTGCAATRDVKFKAYKQEKQRLDQSRKMGNAGYIMGEPKKKSSDDYKKTREVLVFEFSKPLEEETVKTLYEDEIIEASGNAEVVETKIERTSKEFNFPETDEAEFFEGDERFSPTKYVQYTIEDDDTLQKISKKFYDTFSKWPLIYDHNREVIKNPDVLKPGVVIQVPVE